MKRHVYSVRQVNSYIKNMFAQDFMLKKIMISGEISNCKYHSSGHVYFTLKDEAAAIHGVMFASKRKEGLRFPMREGDGVIVTGSLQVYERDGTYQIYASQIILEGGGSLYRKFEQLKHELEEMGMFAPEYKQPVPRYARRIGIVTAPTGAAIQDIRNIAARRNPYVQLILYPALVQGEGAAETIIQGIQALDAFGVDVIIAGRGGGSIEDLWAFNEEAVARAIFECQTPIISAVGHETDTTIADYVADLRAPTPSAAAELAVFDVYSLKEELLAKKQLLERSFRNHFQYMEMRLSKNKARLKFLSPANQLNEKRMQLVHTERAFMKMMEDRIREKRHRLELLAHSFKAASPQHKLSQGFGWVENGQGRPVREVAELKKDERIIIRMGSGIISADVVSVETGKEIFDGETGKQ